MELKYDDSQLQKLFSEMNVKDRMKSMKSAFRREGNYVKKVAISNLRSDLHSNSDLERGIQVQLFKRGTGFVVTIKSDKKTGKGFYTKKNGDKKPVLIWAEEGTKMRRTKTMTKVYRRKRRSHTTGRMKSYCFMADTQVEVRNRVTDDIHSKLEESVWKIAKKYGCK